MSCEKRQDLIYYQCSPFSKPEVGPILGILDRYVEIPTRGTLASSLLKDHMITMFKIRGDPQQGVYPVLFKLCEVVSRFVLI